MWVFEGLLKQIYDIIPRRDIAQNYAACGNYLLRRLDQLLAERHSWLINQMAWRAGAAELDGRFELYVGIGDYYRSDGANLRH